MAVIDRTNIPCGEVTTADGAKVGVFFFVDDRGLVTYYAEGGMALAYDRVSRGTDAEMVAWAKESRPPLDKLEFRLRQLLAGSGSVDVSEATERARPLSVTRNGLGRGMSALMAAVALSADSPAFDAIMGDAAPAGGDDADGIECVICGQWIGDEEAQHFEGDEAADDPDAWFIEPGPAHGGCAKAPKKLRTWLAFGERHEHDDDPPPLPVDDLAFWIREGGELDETQSLMLLDRITALGRELDAAQHMVSALGRKRDTLHGGIQLCNAEIERLREDNYALKMRIEEGEAFAKRPAPPTARQIEINNAVAQAAVWHLVNREPDEALHTAWAVIGAATLLELAEAMDACEKWADRPAETDGPKTVTTRVADRMAAAVYVAAHYDASGKVIVARPDQSAKNKAHAAYVAPASICSED